MFLKYVLPLLLVFSVAKGFNEPIPDPLPDDPGQTNPYPPGDPNQPPAPPPNQPPQKQYPYTLGTGELQRFSDSIHTFYPRNGYNRLINMTMWGGVNNMQVREVRIKYADNGEERFDYYLPGELKARSSRTTTMYGRPVARVIVIASAGYFWKKPGGFRLDVTAVR